MIYNLKRNENYLKYLIYRENKKKKPQGKVLHSTEMLNRIPVLEDHLKSHCEILVQLPIQVLTQTFHKYRCHKHFYIKKNLNNQNIIANVNINMCYFKILHLSSWPLATYITAILCVSRHRCVSKFLSSRNNFSVRINKCVRRLRSQPARPN